MKIKEGFLLREVAKTFIVISVGDSELDFNGVITLNEVGGLIWKEIEDGKKEDEIINKIISEYNVDKDTAKNDFADFINQLKEHNIIEE